MQLGTARPDDDNELSRLIGDAVQRLKLENQSPVPKIGLAVSGGGDSMAMLHLFVDHAETHEIMLYAATVDHGLRAEAKEEAAFVAETCKALNIPHQTLIWRGWAGTGNLQAEARKARYGLLASWAKSLDLDTVAVGHTMDDQAETFLARLARGSGLDGLAGMGAQINRNGVEFCRPLLSVTRENLRQYLTDRGQVWRDDPSNEDEQFQRVRARKILAALEPLGIDRARLSQTANDLSAAKNAVSEMTLHAAKSLLSFDRGDVTINGVAFAETNHEIQRRILIAILRWLDGSDYAPRAEAVQTTLDNIAAGTICNLNGCLVVSGQENIRILREFNAVKDLRSAATDIWDGRWRLEGPADGKVEVRALGEKGLLQCPDWRETGLPRRSLLASPSIWHNTDLIAAPLANMNPEWSATLMRDEKQLFYSIVTH